MAQQYFKIYYRPGLENLADYPTKHHIFQMHQYIRPYYIQMPNSPTELLRASKPRLRRGCVGILRDPYVQHVPLPRIPDNRKPSLGSEPLTWTPDYCVANTAWPKPSLSVQPNGKSIISNISQRTSDISSARLQRRIRVLHSLANILAQYKSS